MSKTPWIRFFPSDWLAGTRGLSAEETGIYITLLMLMYERGEPVPDDPERLARLCGAKTSAFVKITETLISEGKITRADGKIWNERVEKELENLNGKSEAAREAAHARWEKNPKKSKVEECESNADADANAYAPAMQRARVSEARSQKPESPPISPASVAEDPRAGGLADFRKGIVQAFAAAGSMNLNPDTHRAAVWIEQGYDPALCVAVIREVLAKRPNIRSLGYFDELIREAHEKRKPAQTQAAPDEPKHDFGGGVIWPHTTIRRAVDRYLGDPSPHRHWPSILGPPPGEPGCRVPPQLLPPMKGEADGPRPQS